RTTSEVSGALTTRYDESQPQIWRIPLRDDVQPALSVVAPRGGYLVPAAWAEPVATALHRHGINFSRLDAPLSSQPLQQFRASSHAFAAGSLEGRQRLSVEGEWTETAQPLPAGSLFVPIAQPKARLVMALLEPQAPDSLLAWGHFNNAFERKEYMEAYVAEQVAREMLAADPALQQAFEQRLRDDPAFAADPAQRLDFFYQRHSAWDQRYALYPILRSERRPQLAMTPGMR
ncbi:MAG TPA: peptidase M14, partial [Arenimonas sp.]|nr:peptidase M14 [Arenimonas sp.]